MYEPIKKLGQNFLTDITIAQTMVDALTVSNGDDVIEIGPGLGIVTEPLALLARKISYSLYAVEIDERFTDKLDEMYLTDQSVHIINEDILTFLPHFRTDLPTRVIGSLPFYITSPIIHLIIKMFNQPQTVVLLVQKEVGEKLTSDAPDGSYLSAFVQSFYGVTYLQDVPRTKFDPAPEVDGAVILFSKISDQTVEHDLIEKYEGFLHRVYRSPRKMLNKVFSKEELAKIDVEPNRRAQEISAQKWLKAFRL